jgi:hypothetical protein
MNKWFMGGIFGGITNGVFWFAYSMTDNVVGSIGITAAVTIGITSILYKLGQIKKT